MDFVWILILIACAIMAGVFLVVTLAHMEAGSKVKGKWLAYTLCSFAVVAGLVIFKPKPNMEQVQYMPASSSSQEQKTGLMDTAQQKIDGEATKLGSGQAGGEQLQGTAGENQANQEDQEAGSIQDQGQWGSEPAGNVDPMLEEILLLKRQAEGQKIDGEATELGSEQAGGEQLQGTAGENQENQEAQGAGSIQEQGQLGSEPDPMFEEILSLKQQAEERKREEAAKKLLEDKVSSFPGLPGPVNQLDQEQEGQQKTDLFSDEQTGEQADEGNEKESQQLPRGKVLVTLLNVRDNGGLEGQNIGTLHTGDIVEIIGESETGDWLNIKLNSGQTGWVIKKYIIVLP